MDWQKLLILCALAIPALQAQQCDVAVALEREQAQSFVNGVPKLLNAAVDARVAQNPSGQPASLAPTAKRAFASAFDSKAVYADLLSSFARRCVPSQLDAYDTLAQKGLFQTMLRLESTALRPEFDSELAAFRTEVFKDRPSDARLRLIRRFDRAVHRTDTLMAVITSFDGQNQAMFGTASHNLESMTKRLGQEMTLFNLFLYRTVSDEDLLSYIKLMEQPPARWFHQTYNASMSEVMQSRMSMAVHQMSADVQATLSRR
jgi:hypothetical protein